MTRLTELWQPGIQAGSTLTSETTVSALYPGWTKTGTKSGNPFQSFRLLSVTVPFYWTYALSTTLGRSYYAHATFNYYTANDFVATTLLRFRAGSTSLASVRLTSGGAAQLWNDVANSQIGSNVALDGSAGDKYYDIQLKLNIGTGSVDSVEFRLGDTSIASSTGLSLSDSAITAMDVGGVTLASSPTDWVFEDLAVNDDQGAVDNSWPGLIRISTMDPAMAADVGGWLAGAGGSLQDQYGGETSFAGLSSSLTNNSQIRNAVSQANNYAGGQSYNKYNEYLHFFRSEPTSPITVYCDGTRGKVRSYQTIIHGHAEEAATGTKAGSFGIVSNPALSAVTFNFGNDAGAFSANYAGDTTGNWANNRSAVVYDEPDNYDDKWTWRLTKVTATTAVVSVCGLYLLREWYPVPDFGMTSVSEKLVEGLSDSTPVDTAALIGIETVTLSATNLPTDVTVDFNPTAVTPGGSSTMTFTVAGSVTEDTSATINVIGTAASSTRSNPMKIKIRKKPQPLAVYLWGGL